MADQRQRRSLTAARAGGRIRTGGEPDAAAALERALSAPASAPDITDPLHTLHSWPARMHPATAKQLLAVVGGDGPIADPFCGGGTTLVEAQHAGRPTFGVDANPLAILVSAAKTWTPPRARLTELRRIGRDLAAAAFEEGKAARRAGFSPRPRRVPPRTDPDRRNRMLKDWFAPHVRAELEYLNAGILDISDSDPELADRLRVVLSAILHKVSFRTSDTNPTRTERSVGRGFTARLFRDRTDQLCDGLEALARRNPPPARIVLGDARALDRAGITAASLSGAITSPPYGGTYDYADQHRLRMDFFDLSTHELDKHEIGSRRSFKDPAKRAKAVAEWHRALRASFTSLAHSLRPGARAAVILGDSLAGDHPLFADTLIAETRTDRLTVTAWAAQQRRPLGTAEVKAFRTRRKEEWIFLLTRL